MGRHYPSQAATHYLAPAGLGSRGYPYLRKLRRGLHTVICIPPLRGYFPLFPPGILPTTPSQLSTLNFPLSTLPVGRFCCGRRETKLRTSGASYCGRREQKLQTSASKVADVRNFYVRIRRCLQVVGRDKTCLLQRFGKRLTRRKPDIELGDFSGVDFLLGIAAFAVAR